MIDSLNTTWEWQAHGGTILILPVGACEQHAWHMPLATDNIVAEYFAKALGEQLDAAVLPVLPITTSLEHAGFRGSFSLKPETAMQMIRDIADEAERQNFTRLIIVNGHGGNFFLNPVCRDINRLDRPIKLLITSAGQYATPRKADGALDFHAGGWETSVMLAIAPHLVSDDRRDRKPATGHRAKLIQSDLVTFGMGHFAPDGAIGHPSEATAERGKQIVEDAIRDMVEGLRVRLALLDEDPRYSGID